MFHSDAPSFAGHNGFAHSYMHDIFAKAGFENINVETFYKNERIINDKSIPYSLFHLKGTKKQIILLASDKISQGIKCLGKTDFVNCDNFSLPAEIILISGFSHKF